MRENIIDILDYTAEAFEQCQAPDLVDRASLKLRKLIEVVIQYCGKSVDLERQEVILNWFHVLTYLEVYTPEDHHVYSHIVAVFAEKCHRQYDNRNSTWIFDFEEDVQTAIAFKLFLVHIFPFKAMVVQSENPNVFYFSDEMIFFYGRFLSNQEGRIFSHYIHNTLLKTLRSDQFDFSRQFILGLIPDDKGQRRLSNLRPKNRLPYVITPTGTTQLRLDKKPMLTAVQKKGYTQAQSCTLIGDIQSPVFGFSKFRKGTLYGLVTDVQDAHLQRLLMDDGGTVTRIFDCETSETAHDRLLDFRYVSKCLFFHNELRTFQKQNSLREGWRSVTNELLARIRFNPLRSVVFICADTLEARLMAYDFAQELWEEYVAYATMQGKTVNPHYRIPIIFYMPRKEYNEFSKNNHLRFYTQAMYLNDQEKASHKYSAKNGEMRIGLYLLKHYEFLLGLKEISLDLLIEKIEEKENGKVVTLPLALHMIKNGYTRMLTRLLRPPRAKSALKKELIEYLLSENLIQKNDEVIGEFVLVEEFEIASRLIQVTASSKPTLRCNNGSLSVHVINNGNPRQMNYLGLEQMLKQAAANDHCSIIKLCLKEHTINDQSLPHLLLLSACRTKEHTLARMLLERGVSIFGDGVEPSPTRIACDKMDWEMVRLLARYSNDEQDNAEFGYILLSALKFGNDTLINELGLRRVACRKRADLNGMNESTVFYAIIGGRTKLDFISSLIEYELQYTDENTLKRIVYEYIATYEADSSDVRKLLDEKYQAFVTLPGWESVFKASLQERFEDLVNNCAYNRYANIKKLLVFKPSINEKMAKILFEYALVNKDAGLRNLLMSNPECSRETLGDFLQSMMLRDEVSDDRIKEFIIKYNIDVRMDHLRRASELKSPTFLAFLLALFKHDQKVDNELVWNLYQIFQVIKSRDTGLNPSLFSKIFSLEGFLSYEILKTFGKRIILKCIHIHVVSLFHRSYIWPRSEWGQLNAIQTELDRINYIQPVPFSLEKDFHPKIMVYLCDYFSAAEMPSEQLGIKTFEAIFELLEKAVKSSPRFNFSNKQTRGMCFNREVYHFLRDWKKHFHEYELLVNPQICDALFLSDENFSEAKLW